MTEQRAVAEGRFPIYPIETIDQGLELLTGIPAGAPGPAGGYPAGTLDHRIVVRLDAFAAKAAGPARFAASQAGRP